MGTMWKSGTMGIMRKSEPMGRMWIMVGQWEECGSWWVNGNDVEEWTNGNNVEE